MPHEPGLRSVDQFSLSPTASRPAVDYHPQPNAPLASCAERQGRLLLFELKFCARLLLLGLPQTHGLLQQRMHAVCTAQVHAKKDTLLNEGEVLAQHFTAFSTRGTACTSSHAIQIV